LFLLLSLPLSPNSFDHLDQIIYACSCKARAAKTVKRLVFVFRVRSWLLYVRKTLEILPKGSHERFTPPIGPLWRPLW
jgi:hypothetical protein